MRRLEADTDAPFDFWEYFESIPSSDFQRHDCSAGSVSYVWEHPRGLYQHVLVNSDDENVFMVLVLDITNKHVLGHRLLNLKREYGIESGRRAVAAGSFPKKR